MKDAKYTSIRKTTVHWDIYIFNSTFSDYRKQTGCFHISFCTACCLGIHYWVLYSTAIIFFSGSIHLFLKLRHNLAKRLSGARYGSQCNHNKSQRIRLLEKQQRFRADRWKSDDWSKANVSCLWHQWLHCATERVQFNFHNDQFCWDHPDPNFLCRG